MPQKVESMDYLMPNEVFKRFGVSHDTLRRWAVEGKIECLVLPSGHRRYPACEVERLLAVGRAKTERKLQTARA